jgi:hypothetical protein
VAGKVILTLFWDINRPILEHYMSKGRTITNASYSDLLVNHLKPAIQSKRHGIFTTGVLLLHVNAWPHTAHVTFAKIKDLHSECLPHALGFSKMLEQTH